MKTSNRVHQNGATKPVSPQAKIQTSSGPAEFKIVRLRECPVDNPRIETPAEVADFWRKHVVSAPWYKDDKECLCVFLLNTRRRLLGFELVSLGTLDAVLSHPREVLRPAAIQNAAAIIIAHNHPSGDPSPSEADIKFTRDLIQAALHLKIELLDSIIIGGARRGKPFTSLRGLGYFDPADSTPVSATAAVSASGGLDAIDALDLLKNCASAAIALAMMNADEIKDRTKANAGWEDLESASFQDGNLELPRLLADQFENNLSAWRDEVNRMVQKSTLPEVSAAGHGHDTENAVNALKHLLDLQGAEISNRNKNGAFAASFVIMARLEAAFHNAWKVCGYLKRTLDGGKIPQAA
jgi:DNA repair protein RadC